MAVSIYGLCPPTGPVLPLAHIPAQSGPSGLTSKLDILAEDTNAPWNISTTSFSLELTSGDGTFFTYHRTAPLRDERGADEVTSDTVYRVASVTKAFNVLTLLINARADLDRPVTEFIPELHGSATYGEITLRMLASSLSAVPRDGKGFDMYVRNGAALQQSGFPIPANEDIPMCDSVTGELCSREEFFDTLLQDSLALLPGDRAAYSNQAYILLGFALENITGKPFVQLVEDSIMKPLNMTSTGFEPPDLSRASIAVGDGSLFMGFDIGNFKATAGLYSTPRDLTTFVQSILNSTLMSPTHTRQWLKPVAFTGSLSTAVGMPWEIFRLSNITPDNRTIDIYTKLGSITGYSAYIVIIPDYHIGASIIASGDDADAATWGLLDLIATLVVPWADSLTRDQARDKYVGEYTNGNESLIISMDQGPGLRIESWTSGSHSILEALAKERSIPLKSLYAWIYPVGEGNWWQMALEQTDSGQLDSSLPSSGCTAWTYVDQLRYAGRPVDKFQFRIEGGNVKGVDNPGLRASYQKVD
ncbi:hypothetical protein jhhlp_001699 [Lomentospora prolificans]|uniref:Uncharacterized protein n=1 Tax=Lomentospora prolificans TaxID=41688 RepID=A0A2N3NH39_9PEZI|nr:hypothetical protein jhhlp_001699 [Lomentospora prolificans]